MQNANHPKKGSRIAVDPIRKMKDIKAIMKLLSDNPRDRLLFTIGINNGLRTIDLLNLKVKDIRHLKSGDTIKIKESKTGKTNILAINKTVYKALRDYLGSEGLNDGYYLFKSRKGNMAIQSQAVSKLVKKWTSDINLKGNYGAHTLRKIFGVGFEIICKRYNHSSPAITMRYLGIEDKEVNEILLNNEIG